MNSKTHKSAIVLSPPAALWGPIQEIRQIHDRNIRRWMPHITLVYPFRPQSHFREIVGSFSGICKLISPFEVQMQAFQYFQHGRKGFTLWLSPEPKESFDEFQNLLMSEAQDCDEVRRHENGFTPHLSVGQLSNHSELCRIRDELQANWKSLTFRAAEVCLISRGDPPDDVFRIDYRIQLGSGEIITE